MSAPVGWPRRSLGAKLLVAQMLVVIAGSLTLVVVALAVAPGVFHAHVRMALGPVSPQVGRHLDEGLATAMLVALATGTGVAVATALGVSLLLARRIAGPLGALARAAGHIARGRYTARVPQPPGGDELASLAVAFNTMAQALEASEQRRRQLLADLAHELRNPLATIDGYLEGVADQVMPSDQQTLQVLQAETARLRRLVDDLGAVSRAEERQFDLHPVACHPKALLGAAVQAAQPAYTAKGVTLHTSIDPHLPHVRVDPDRIGEVLANLLANALRHTPPGGRVEVAANTTSDGRVQLSVSDTGEGIPPELLERIFERFYRVDPARTHTHGGGGSGIGLTISRAIVHVHGGQIRAHSQGPGHGARFTITLPAQPTRPRRALTARQGPQRAME
jgi:two-component system sensor histidine kinase BaeS